MTTTKLELNQCADRRSGAQPPARQISSGRRPASGGLRVLWLAAWLAVSAPRLLSAATNELTSTLQKGLFEEEANRNLDAAIAAYQSLVTQFDKDRQIAATAVFRLGECYRKLGRTNDALVQYQRIIRDFSDQNTLATLSRQNLAGMGMSATAAASPQSSNSARQEQRGFLEKQIQLSEQDVAEARKRFETGLAPQAEVRAAEREVLRLKQELAALDAGRPDLLLTGVGSDAAAGAEAEAASLKAQVDQLKKLNAAQRRVAVQQNFPNPVLTKLAQDLTEARQKRVTLEKNYQPDHPEMVAAQELNAIINAQIDNEVENVVSGLQIKADMAAETAKNLRAKSGTSGTVPVNDLRGISTTDEEELEIRRIQAMVRNSPDLINAPVQNPDEPNGGSFTPLYRAAAVGQLVVARFLLDNGADVNKTVYVNHSQQNRTPLHGAAGNGRKAMAELLLSRGANPNAKDTGGNPRDEDGGRSPLHLAAQNGFNAVVEVLLSHKAEVNARKNDGQTPLHAAVLGGQLSTVELLLQNGADVNAAGKNGQTPLFVYSANESMLNALLAAKANPNISDSNGRTPLSYAAEYGWSGPVKALLAAKADPNIADKQGLTPLYFATQQNRLDALKLLLEARADSNRTGSGVTLLNLAVASTNVAILELLLEHGAKPNAETLNLVYAKPDSKWTVLNLAVYHGIIDVVPALLKHGADPNLRDVQGRTPLHYGAGSKRMMELLLGAKPDVNAKNDVGDTPLHWAVCANGPEPATLLLAGGANVNATNEKGQTPLHLAVWKGNEGMVQLLLTNKANPNLRDNDGRTPLDMAVRPISYSLQNVALGVSVPLVVYSGTTPRPAVMGPASQQFAKLLKQYGATDDLPKMDRIVVRRPGSTLSVPVFWKGTNDWNRFALFETIYNFYQTGDVPVEGIRLRPGDLLPFPDLTHVVIVHRPAGSNETRKEINLFNGPNRIDCTRDVALEFGDVVEIPERVHPLDQVATGLTDEERGALRDCLGEGKVGLRAGDNRVQEFPVFARASDCLIGSVLGRQSVRQFLLSSSDLSHVKVKRTDRVTGKKQEWILNCSNPNNLPDLWLRDGDVIEVPEK